MKTKFFILIALALMYVFQACQKQNGFNAELYIVLKDGNAEIIEEDTIEIDSVSLQELLIESNFEGSAPRYLRQIDNGEIMDISGSSDIDLISNGKSEIEFEKLILTTNVTDLHLTSGSVIKITVRLDTELLNQVKAC